MTPWTLRGASRSATAVSVAGIGSARRWPWADKEGQSDNLQRDAISGRTDRSVIAGLILA